MKAMILAAGMGTRLQPFTNEHPKALVEVNGKTILQRNIEYLAGFGIRDLVINVHHFADQVEAYLKEHGNFHSRISVSDEREMLLETGWGLKKAAPFLREEKEPFVVMNVDVLTDLDLSALVREHRKTKALVTLAVTTRVTSRYLLFDELLHLCGWKNERTGEQKISRDTSKYYPKAFSGIHVISPAIFPLITLDGRFSIIDLYLELARTQQILAFDHSNTRYIDVGRPASVAEAEKLFR